MNIHEAKTMGQIMGLILKVSSKAEGRRFIMGYIEAAPDLTEDTILENIKFGLSHHFDGGEENDRLYRKHLAYFV